MSETVVMSLQGSSDSFLAAGRSRILQEADALRLAADALDESFVAAVRLLRLTDGKVVTVGVGTSGPVARRMAHLLSTSGTPSLFLHPGDALHGGLGAITTNDVVLAISKGGGSAEFDGALDPAPPTTSAAISPASRQSPTDPPCEGSRTRLVVAITPRLLRTVGAASRLASG